MGTATATGREIAVLIEAGIQARPAEQVLAADDLVETVGYRGLSRTWATVDHRTGERDRSPQDRFH